MTRTPALWAAPGAVDGLEELEKKQSTEEQTRDREGIDNKED